MSTRIQPTAQVAESATVGDGSSVWELAQIREDARLGSRCVVGRGAYVGTGVVMGDHCKLQNYALVYEPARLGHGVFVGPAAVLTNDEYPRAVTPGGDLKSASDWRPVGVEVDDGASLGARSVCVAPVRVGRWAMVAAGAVVTKDVPDFALVVGVPARRVGWVGKAGRRLEPVAGSGAGASDARPSDGPVGRWRCPATGAEYVEKPGPDGEPRLVEADA